MDQYYLMMNVTGWTRTWTLVGLTQERLEKLNLIGDLYNQDLNNWEIADHLNLCRIRSPHDGAYFS